MAENPLECAWVKEMFAGEAQGEEWGDTYAGVYEHYGLMGPGTILAHCVHLNDEQKEIIRRTGAGVSHCPGSNLFLNSGAARIRELLDLGIKVCLIYLIRNTSHLISVGRSGARLFRWTFYRNTQCHTFRLARLEIPLLPHACCDNISNPSTETTIHTKPLLPRNSGRSGFMPVGKQYWKLLAWEAI